jgi:hypothetical protein
MKRTFMGMLAAMAISLVPATSVVAEEITFASHAEIMSVLERQNTRIAELEAALQNGGGCSSCNGGGGSCCDSCNSCSGCCGGCCDPCCRPAGVIGSAELLFLKPHTSAGTGAFTDFGWDYEPAYRLTAGYQGSDGLGWRARYFEFDHAQTGVTGADVQAFDTYVLDLEFIDSMSLGCYWDASFFGGFRYLEMDHTRGVAGVAGSQAYQHSDIGLTIGGELRRCIGNGLAGYANTRASVMLGDETEWAVLATGAPFVVRDNELDNIYYIWEAQTGVQWTNELQSGGYLFARAGVEVQIWDNAAGSGPGFANAAGTEDFGLAGLAFAAGIIR